MRTLFLTSSGLNEKTMVLFWKCIGIEPSSQFLHTGMRLK